MLTAYHWIELGVLDGGVGEETEEAEGFCSLMKGATVSTGQTFKSSQGQDHQPKNTHGRTHGSSYVAENGLVGHQWEERPFVPEGV